MNLECLPFNGIKVIEFAGLAPVPFCGMVMADFGAEVTVIINTSSISSMAERRLDRGKARLELDFQSKDDMAHLKQLCCETDVLLDPFRPGILEALRLDPVELIKTNQKLIIARLTGYGQTGPLAHKAGHDINYVALSGLFQQICVQDDTKPPWPPSNILADFAGGGLLAVTGVAMSLYHRSVNGNKGCILDCSMVEGLAYLGTFITLYKDVDYLWKHPYSAFSGKCPIYRTYKTKDNKWMAVGALEPKFHNQLFDILNIKTSMADLNNLEALIAEMETIFGDKTQQEWIEIFMDADACVTPVLSLKEVGLFSQHSYRQSFDGTLNQYVPRPAPRMYTHQQFSQIKSSLEKSKL